MVLKNRTFLLTFIFACFALSSCGKLFQFGGDKGLFDTKYSAVSIARPNEATGLWEWENGPSTNNTSAIQQTYGVSYTRTRLQINAMSDQSMRITTICERRNANNSNNIVSTYVNSDALVIFEVTAGATNSGRATITGYRNTQVSGEKDYACVPILETGIYTFQVQDGRLYMNLTSPLNYNGTSNQVSATTIVGVQSSFVKVRD